MKNKDRGSFRLLVTADWHLRDDVPICRKESNVEFRKVQLDKVDWVCHKANELNASLVCAGDMFHVPRPSYGLLNGLLKVFHRNNVVPLVVAGQHDLTWHSPQQYSNSALGLLIREGFVQLLDAGVDCGPIQGSSWDEDRVAFPHGGDCVVYVTHHPIAATKGDPSTTPSNFLSWFKDSAIRVVIAGDRHTPLRMEKYRKLLIVPGSLTRIASNQTHEPQAWFVRGYSRSVEVTSFVIPHDRHAIQQEHLDEKAERDSRVAAFVKSLAKDRDVQLSFVDNLKKALNDSKVGSGVRRLILEALAQ